MTNKTLLYGVLMVMSAFMLLTTLNSCKDKKEEVETVETYSSSKQTTLVTAFSLQADADVLPSLDSVYFTVDVNNGLIYNADSLPVGTDISSLKVRVNFLNTVSSAVFSTTGAKQHNDTTVNYSTSMTTALDFTGKTLLTVTSSDLTQVKTYEVKVLVHNENPDSLKWNESWRHNLPGLTDKTQAFKVVRQGDVYRAMAYDGTACYLMTADHPTAVWTNQQANVPFEPQIATFTATSDALYMLADDGGLWTSADGQQWTACGVKWHSLFGGYNDRVLGILAADGAYLHDEYPRTEGFVPSVVEGGFPIAHSSDMIVTDNKWAVSQQAIIVGGYDVNGRLLSDVWGYDGSNWGKINNAHSGALPALADATLMPYYTYRSLPGIRRYARQSTWYVMGGKLADGTLNGKIYLSNTQGITWAVGDSTISQPSFIPKFYGAQALVDDELLSAGGPNRMPDRVKTLVTSWDCPYIYLFGGYNSEDELLPWMWCGVYNRLTNTPIY